MDYCILYSGFCIKEAQGAAAAPNTGKIAVSAVQFSAVQYSAVQFTAVQCLIYIFMT